MSLSELPSLVQLRATAPPPPPTHVEERGGPWDSISFDPSSFPALQSTLPMTVIFRKDQGGWKHHLLIAESALLHRAGAPPGLGVYALRKFRGPREVTVPRSREITGDDCHAWCSAHAAKDALPNPGTSPMIDFHIYE